jgi:iron complex transport system substrate-binding protein
MKIDRRSILAGLSAVALGTTTLAPRFARAASVKDSSGRVIETPDKVTRIFPAGPPAAILLYTLAPDLMLGWTRAPSPAEREFLTPEAAAKPELGRITGRGNTANLEVVLAQKPDLILDVGSLNQTYVSLAERVRQQTGIPYALLDGRFDATAATYRLLGKLTGREERAEMLASYAEEVFRTVSQRIGAIPLAERPLVYYARGTRGLETGLGGSINVESIELLARNAAGGTKGGMANVSIEQVLTWNPDAIFTIEPAFAENIYREPGWSALQAVQKKRVYLSPRLPFGWIDFPPSVNRLIGLRWLGKILYPERFPEDLNAITRDFYKRFYHVDLSDAQLARVLSGRG